MRWAETVLGKSRDVDSISEAGAPDMRLSWRGLVGIAERCGWAIEVVDETS
jgi:hypothetical protein